MCVKQNGTNAVTKCVQYLYITTPEWDPAMDTKWLWD